MARLGGSASGTHGSWEGGEAAKLGGGGGRSPKTLAPTKRESVGESDQAKSGRLSLLRLGIEEDLLVSRTNKNYTLDVGDREGFGCELD